MRKPGNLLLILAGTCILMIVGFYNGYPLIYSDTGTYIFSGFGKFIPRDRPISYGLFVRYFSFGFSLWPVILLQNLMTAFVLFELMVSLKIQRDKLNFIYLFTLSFLVFFTGTGWYSNQVIPDFLAPLGILILFILIRREHIPLVNRIILILILLFSLVSHLSHPLIYLVVLLLILLSRFLFKSRLREIPLRRILLTGLIIPTGLILLPSIGYLVEKKFIISASPHVFIVGHLNDTGILKMYLDENCQKKEFSSYKLCQIKDSLPPDISSFVWSGDYVKKTGGWSDSNEEYRKIITATLTQPRYLLLNIYKSLQYGLVQLTKNEIGQGLSPYRQGSAPYVQLNSKFHHELNQYLNSRQYLWGGTTLKLNALNHWHHIILILSVLLTLLVFTPDYFRLTDPWLKLFLLYVLLAIVVNSFLTAGFNSPCERFQARVVWMLPLALLILILDNFLSRKKENAHLSQETDASGR